MSYVLSVSLNIGMFIWVFYMRDILRKECLEVRRYRILRKVIRKKYVQSRADSRLGAEKKEMEK